jgi:copper transport protein
MMRRLAFAALVIVAAVLASAGVANAHAVVDSSNPAAGSQVNASPQAVTLHFTERPDPKLSTVHVVNSSGAHVESAPAAVDPGDPHTIRVPVPALPNGTYTVTWRTTSADDGHTTAGSFAFGVGEPPAAGAAAATTSDAGPSSTALGTIARALLYAGLSLLLGAAVVAMFLSPPKLPNKIAITVSWAAAALGGVLLGLDEARQADTSLSNFLTTASGKHIVALWVGLVLAGCAVAAYWFIANAWMLVGIGGIAAATMFIRVQGGHASASDQRWFTEPTQWLHWVAVGAWVGALPWFVTALRQSGFQRPLIARRFARIATYGVIVVLITGTIRAFDEVGSWSALWDTTFGTTLLIKVAFVAVIVGIGIVNHFVFVHRAESTARPLLRATTAEIGVGAIVLLVTGVLTGLTPSSTLAAIPSNAPKAPPATVLEQSDYATTIKVKLTIAPGYVGANTFTTAVTDYDTGQPEQVNGVQLRFAIGGRTDVPSSTLSLSSTPKGDWSAQGTNLSVVGVWTVTAVVTKAAGGVDVPFRVQAAPADQKNDVLPTPGQPTIYEATMPTGEQVQIYSDPGGPGRNQFHVTFFTASGTEQPIDTVQVIASSPDGRDTALTTRRLSPGHFVADNTLTPGQWAYTVYASGAASGNVAALVNTDVAQ